MAGEDGAPSGSREVHHLSTFNTFSTFNIFNTFTPTFVGAGWERQVA